MHRLFSIANEISMAFGIFVFLFFINTKLKAEGNSTSMAFVTSVVSDYSFDAMRNPALLGLHNSRYSVGFFIGSGPHATVDVDVYDSNMKFDSMSEFIVQSGAAFVYTTKSYAIGLAISNISQENLYKSSESELALHAYLEDAKADIEASATVAEKIYAPAIYIAMAFPIAHTLFFGIQGNAGIKRKNLKQHVDGTIFFSIPQYIHSDFHSQMKEYIFEAGAGLLKKLERGHVGLFLRSGKISSSTVKGEYLASFVPEQHQQATNPLRYVSGMSLVAGFYIRPLELFGCAIESGYRFPAEYRDNTISEGDGSLQEQAYLQHVGERYDLKAAFEWLGIAHMRIATGIWIYKEINEKNSLFDVQDDVKRYEHQKLSFVAITAGVSYRLYESFFITFSTAYVSGNIDVSTYNRTVMTAEYRNIMVLAGINMNF